MQQQLPSRRNQLFLFARNFFKHPKMLGSLIPSSRFLIERVLQYVDWRRAELIVEFGPGVGTFTTEILKRMRPDGRLIVFETNADFVRFLRTTLRDARLQVEHRSAAEIESLLGPQSVDYVISGIPFSTLPDAVRRQILQATRAALRPDGEFLVYQFSPKVGPYLQQDFKMVRRDFELRNILPAHFFRCLP